MGCPWSKQQFLAIFARDVSEILEIEIAIGASISDRSNQVYSEPRQYSDGRH